MNLLLLPKLKFLLFLIAPAIHQQNDFTSGLGYLAMALAVGIACIGAGYAVAKSGAAAIASITEKPELFARALIFVGLAEGIAIYGIIIGLLIWITL